MFEQLLPCHWHAHPDYAFALKELPSFSEIGVHRERLCRAQLRFKDRTAYNRYQTQFLESLRGHDGLLLVADEIPVQLEGEWNFEKVVILSFVDEVAFNAWAYSDAYQRILTDRKLGADAVVILAHGVN